MIAIDTNILLHAHRPESPFHAAAYRSVLGLFHGGQPWSIPWPCVHEFLAVATSSGKFRTASPMEVAIRQVEIWMECDTLVLLEETNSHWPMLARTLRASGARGGGVHDARIAAICLEHGVRELWTADRDFRRFPGLATFNPLEDDRVHEDSPTWAAAKRARAAGRRRALAESRNPG